MDRWPRQGTLHGSAAHSERLKVPQPDRVRPPRRPSNRLTIRIRPTKSAARTLKKPAPRLKKKPNRHASSVKTATRHAKTSAPCKIRHAPTQPTAPGSVPTWTRQHGMLPWPIARRPFPTFVSRADNEGGHPAAGLSASSFFSGATSPPPFLVTFPSSARLRRTSLGSAINGR